MSPNGGQLSIDARLFAVGMGTFVIQVTPAPSLLGREWVREIRPLVFIPNRKICERVI